MAFAGDQSEMVELWRASGRVAGKQDNFYAESEALLQALLRTHTEDDVVIGCDNATCVNMCCRKRGRPPKAENDLAESTLQARLRRRESEAVAQVDLQPGQTKQQVRRKMKTKQQVRRLESEGTVPQTRDRAWRRPSSHG